MAAECCDTCRHWLPDSTAKKGDCRRYPPVLDRLGTPRSPTTPADHWCGEWLKKK